MILAIRSSCVLYLSSSAGGLVCSLSLTFGFITDDMELSSSTNSRLLLWSCYISLSYLPKRNSSEFSEILMVVSLIFGSFTGDWIEAERNSRLFSLRSFDARLGFFFTIERESFYRACKYWIISAFMVFSKSSKFSRRRGLCSLAVICCFSLIFLTGDVVLSNSY